MTGNPWNAIDACLSTMRTHWRAISVTFSLVVAVGSAEWVVINLLDKY